MNDPIRRGLDDGDVSDVCSNCGVASFNDGKAGSVQRQQRAQARLGGRRRPVDGITSPSNSGYPIFRKQVHDSIGFLDLHDSIGLDRIPWDQIGFFIWIWCEPNFFELNKVRLDYLSASTFIPLFFIRHSPFLISLYSYWKAIFCFGNSFNFMTQI